MKAAPFAAGELRHRIKLQSPTTTKDSVGGITTTWSDEATVSAKIEPLSATRKSGSSEDIIGGAEVAQDWVIATIRPRTVLTSWQFIYDSLAYDIKAVRYNNDRSVLTLYAQVQRG